MTDQERAERTSWLKKSVAVQAQELEPEGRSREAARDMVPYCAHHLGLCDDSTVASLAVATGITRQWLSAVLFMDQPGYNVRRQLEEFLGLTAGGMTDVLSVLEAL